MSVYLSLQAPHVPETCVCWQSIGAGKPLQSALVLLPSASPLWLAGPSVCVKTMKQTVLPSLCIFLTSLLCILDLTGDSHWETFLWIVLCKCMDLFNLQYAADYLMLSSCHLLCTPLWQEPWMNSWYSHPQFDAYHPTVTSLWSSAALLFTVVMTS